MANFYLAGLRAVRSFHTAQNDFIRAMERISTGLRINRAADDPSGLAISERMRAQIRGLKQASRNAQDAISLLNIADGALGETHAVLHRLREIAVYSATGTLTQQERDALQIEFNELVKAIDDIGANTNFNTIPLLNGERNEENPLIIQIGANAGQNTEISLGNMTGRGLDLYDEEGNIISVSSQEDADRAIGILDDAINKTASQRAYIGAKTRRLEHTINNLENTAINLAAAESRIRDADIALEVLNMVQAQIRMQAALAMVAQANVAQQMILQLLWPS
ncbi:MAG: flagellin [Firmicutes bacterium]|jgi:flagellin|nr:flagellin [Bacillota bacterium]NLO66391.1 flagellin [Bacillota bacterium]